MPQNTKNTNLRVRRHRYLLFVNLLIYSVHVLFNHRHNRVSG